MPCKPYLLTGLAAALLAAGLAGPASAQSQSPSVAEATRRAREQKKAATKPVRILTDDDLPKAATPEASRPAVPPAAEPAKPEEEAKPPATDGAQNEAAKQQEARKKAELRAALKQAKADLAQAEGELDVLQRKTTLDSDAYYSKTDYARDTAGKTRLEDDQRQVNDKKNEVQALKAKIAALEAAIGEKP